MSTHKHETRPSVNPENFNRVDTDELPSIHNVLPSAPEDASRLKKTSRKKIIIGATATAAAAALGASIFVGITKGNEQAPVEQLDLHKSDTNSSTTHEVDPTLNPTTYPMFIGDTPLSIATKFTKNMTSLEMDGANNFVFRERFTEDKAGNSPTDDQITAKVLAEVKPIYEKVFFGTTDETKISPDNLHFIAQSQVIEKSDIEDYFSTGSDNQTPGTQSYARSIEAESINSTTTNADGSETINFTAVEHQNVNNVVGDKMRAENITNWDGQQDNITLTVKPSGNIEYVEGVTFNK